MDVKHTPGPWFAEPMVGEADAVWIGNTDGYVAQITREDGLEAGDWVDARLISAAPDLLAALEWAVDTADAEQYEAGWYADARMAIAKAKGLV